ncbi:MAG: outer membrane beta-barrel protein [Marinirhabdus sp.]|nr:outer membrane beta-barrel protein [Marinirhabdus sp.]
MKKLLLFVALITVGTLTTQAQETKFGLKAGVNFASVFGDNLDEFDGQTDFHVGGVLSVGLNSWLSLQPELVYSRQGYSLEDSGFDIKGNLDYINLPILVDFTIAEGFSLHGGPQFGFNLVSEEAVDGESFKFDTKSVLISNAIGAQYQLPDNGLFFQLRYSSDFVTIAEEDDINVFNSVFSASIGWFFQ